MNTNEMKVLTLEGAPRERGRTMGEALRQDIHALLEKQAYAIESIRGYSPPEYYRALANYGDYVAAAERWAPDLLEEVWGVAEGAGISPETAFRLQLLDEDWFFDTYHYTPAATVRNKCTAFAIVDDAGAPTYAGQNMDIQSFVDGHQVLLRTRYPGSDLESLVFTYAGFIGLCGMNNAPLGVNCNTLIQHGIRPDGLPVAFIVRSLLGMGSYDAAVRFLNQIQHAVGQNYTLSTAGRIGAYECSPNQVVEYKPRVDGRRVCHTNHPLANDDTESFQALVLADPCGTWVRGESSTRSRFASIAARTLNHEGPIGLDHLKAALRAKDDPDNPVCCEKPATGVAGVINFTAGSMVYEFAEKARLHLAAGPPSVSEFVTFPFSD